jgi:hypothetical protein
VKINNNNKQKISDSWYLVTGTRNEPGTSTALAWAVLVCKSVKFTNHF